MKMGRREKKYSLKNIAKILKMERKELYNLSKKDFYKSEALIISTILKSEDKNELLKIFKKLKKDEEPNLSLKDYKDESEEIKEGLDFIKKTKITSQELIDYFYLKEKKEDMLKTTENLFYEELQKRKDIFKDNKNLFES